jgi:putative transposase
MPQKNTIKEYAPESYYHVYSRGANKQKIFQETDDYYRFLSLFDRYLTAEQKVSKKGGVYPNYSKEVNLAAYCLMPNHIHLLIYQNADREALRKFMSSLMTSYSKYFNKKYRRVGSLFESRYKAKRIDEDSYLAHISRYIHMNPQRWSQYKYSSLHYMFSNQAPEWLTGKMAVGEFKNRIDYMNFLQQYQENKDIRKEIKHQLADTS